MIVVTIYFPQVKTNLSFRQILTTLFTGMSFCFAEAILSKMYSDDT